MNHTELATLLAAADEPNRHALLAQHPHFHDLQLAHTLKDIARQSWASDPQQTVGAAAALRRLASLAPNAEIDALATWATGSAALLEGQMEQALTQLEQAVGAFHDLGDDHAAASAKVSTVMALAMLGRYDEATAIGLEAHDVFLAHGDLRSAGNIAVNIGNLFFRRDQYAEAETWYQLALSRFQATNDTERLVDALTNLADVYTWRYQFAQADQFYQQALQLAQQQDLAAAEAGILGNSGVLALFRGRYDAALSYLEQARRAYASLHMPHDLTIAELDLADAYLELNLAAEAATLYERIIPALEQTGSSFEAGWANTNYARACLLLKRYDTARQFLTQARALFEAEGNAVWQANVRLIEGQLFLAIGRTAAAEACAVEAETLFVASGSHGQAVLARTLHGEALLARGQAAEARNYFRLALRDAHSRALPHVAQRCLTALGQIAAAAGDLDGAGAMFTEAIAIIEQVRAPLPAEEFRSAFVADKLTPFDEYAKLCLSAGRVTEAFTLIERARSRALVDMLSGSVQLSPQPRDAFEAELVAQLEALREELNWIYRQIARTSWDDHSASASEKLELAARDRETRLTEVTHQLQRANPLVLAQSEPFDIERFQDDLGSDTALIEYYAFGDELLALVVSDQGVSVVRELTSDAAATALISRLRFLADTMRHGSERIGSHQEQLARQSRHYLRQLYDLLVRPLESHVGDRRLIVVPHRTLHYVPFHALFDGTHHLIERREVSTAPSASVLHQCLTRPTTRRQRALLLGVSDDRVPAVRAEVEALAPLFTEAIALVDEQATTEALYRHASAADVIHLACHGSFRHDNPLFSSLHLADSRLTVRDAYQLTLNCDLVVLSACETGVSAIAPGDELIGLARGFFAAGTPSLLVSLWPVEDTVTSRLMQHFYRHLCAGERPAAALRLAQQTMLTEGTHPLLWSPFVLMGRW